LNWIFLLDFWKKIGHTTREGNGKNWNNSVLKFELKFENIGHSTIGKWKKLKYATKIWNEKVWNFSFFKIETKKFEIFIFEIWNEKIRFLKFEMRSLKILIFEIWNENFFLKFENKLAITRGKWKKNWNEDIICFIYVTEIKLAIIPLYHLCIPPACKSALKIWFWSKFLDKLALLAPLEDEKNQFLTTRGWSQYVLTAE
jgi:hypothetical protein